MKFTKVQSGEWVQPTRRGYLMKCCDCGLVHSLDFRLVQNKFGPGRKIQLRAFRVDRKMRRV